METAAAHRLTGGCNMEGGGGTRDDGSNGRTMETGGWREGRGGWRLGPSEAGTAGLRNAGPRQDGRLRDCGADADDFIQTESLVLCGMWDAGVRLRTMLCRRIV